MNIKAVLLVVLMSSLILFGASFAFLSWIKIRQKHTAQMQFHGKTLFKNVSLMERWNHFLQRSYMTMSKIPGLSSYIQRIRKRISGVHAYDEFRLRRETTKITLGILGILGVSVLILFTLNPSVSFLLMVLLTAVIINSLLIDMYVNRMEKKLLVQMIDLFSEVRHRYQQHEMIDEALYEAAESAGYEASVHTRKIYEALNAKDPSEELEKFYETAPNRFLKAFAGISFMIMEFGDKVKEQGSIYLQGLSGLTKEIQLEILRRDKLDYLLKGLNVIALAPVFFTKPIERWARSSFPAMDEFYTSKLGYITKIIIFIVIILSFVLLQRLQQDNETTYRWSDKKKNWEQFLSSFSVIRLIASFIAPKPATPAYAQMIRLLKESSTHMRYEWFYIRRIMFFILSFAVTMTIMMILHQTAKSHILYAPVDGNTFFGQVSSDQREAGHQLSDQDLMVMKEVGMSSSASYDEIAKRINGRQNANPNKDTLVNSTNRILSKLKAYNQEYLKWWEILTALLIGWAGYQFPLWLLYFQRKIRYMDMRHEVYQFQTVISMLREMERISVEEILEWMNRFAIIFKVPIQRCVLHYDHGAEMALTQLKEQVRLIEFQRIVDKLLLCVEKIPIAQAFDDLENEMSFYFEQRKQEYEKMIDTKAGLGKMLGFTPMYALIFMYLVVPLIVISFMQMNVYYEQIQKI
ncbi:hypothetical protein J23TS9_10360 [Paenibacillus sp. J23TS9]|uniref:hypothetical protein n=1 Tax=Paenibacillus sp. J23TS9 TaxID=2807193 RepID=UPI001B23E6A9|nr:hypothetical protein [Paenibacillus sp. J23TS9]GIP25906.1 hypothetical protein J23TS9_10360 [Paenibacillus sp. J23TS9]